MKHQPANNSAQKPRPLRRVLFALIPALVFLTLFTLILFQLEKRGILCTEGIDDRVAMPPVDLLKTIHTDDGDFYSIQSPFLLKSRVPVQKKPGTFRILASGGSFMLGTPYVNQTQTYPSYGSIPDWIRAELAARYPSKNIEMINAAAGAQNSFRVRTIVETLLEVNPDLVIVATGNNEGHVPATDFNEDLHQWVLYRALKKALIRPAAPAQRSYFTPQNATVEEMFDGYETNIRSIIEMTTERQIPLILATLPINVKFIPEKDQLPPRVFHPEDDPDLQKGRHLCNEGKVEEAMAAFAQSKNQSFAPRFIAECFEKTGDFEKAREFYMIYVEQLPFNRMRPSFNRLLRDIAKEKGILLADLENRLEANSPNQIARQDLFFDFCHMKWQGYYLLAGEIIDLILQEHLVQGGPGEPLGAPSRDEIIERENWQPYLPADPTIP